MQNKNYNSRGAGFSIVMVEVVLLLLLAAVLMFYFAANSRNSAAQSVEVPRATVSAETAPPATAPVPAVMTVVTPSGTKKDVTFRASYTISEEEATKEASKVVITAGKDSLTNAQLQIYFQEAVKDYLETAPETLPDFSQPLENQLCPLGNGNLSWQHYFLEQAVEKWLSVQALVQRSKEPQKIQEEAFQPNVYQDLHTPNIKPELPVNNFLYQDLPYYTPNEIHQAYLDGMETTLKDLAKEQGYESLEAYAKAVGVESKDLVEAAKTYNLGYMYFTERSYYVEVKDSDVTGTAKKTGEHTVNLRHILLIPEGAKVAADGVVKATQEQWQACEVYANDIISRWIGSYPTNMIPNGRDVNFSRWAYQETADQGSLLNGGMYSNVSKGQLIAPLDKWCFASDRKVNDYDVIRSDLGVHIVFLSAINQTGETAAREALTLAAETKEWQSYRKKLNPKVDYSAAAIWTDCTAKTVPLADTLYPDVGHERFPKAMVYLQQDYATTSYGSSTVGRGGCGVTTMAMLATYMMDEIITPAMLAGPYANYHDENGTMAEMFRYVPAEIGFQMERQSYNVDEAIEALQSGRRVVSLQYFGHFTSAGHYLLLQEYYPKNDTFQVRDSNIANYGKLSGHKVDYFTRADIMSGGTNFFIIQPKLVRTPVCTRCGDGKETLLISDYLCDRCRKEISRHDNFLSILEG